MSRKGFGSIHAASGMKQYLDKKIKSEIERNKPSMRTATVVGIDRAARKCEVRYPGEEGTVRVPYGAVEPAGTGSRVKIDGPVGERRIVDVIGGTRSENRLDRIESMESVAPLWASSIYEWAETYPLMFPRSGNQLHDKTKAHCSPLVIQRDMHVHRVEVKFAAFPVSNVSGCWVRLGLHKVDLDDRETQVIGGESVQGDPTFDLKFVNASGLIYMSSVDENTQRPSFVLHNPVDAKAGEVYVISIYSYNTAGVEINQHPKFEILDHPTPVQRFGRNQFTRGWYDQRLMGGDIPRSAIESQMTRTIWGALFPLPPGEGGESGTPEGEI